LAALGGAAAAWPFGRFSCDAPGRSLSKVQRTYSGPITQGCVARGADLLGRARPGGQQGDQEVSCQRHDARLVGCIRSGSIGGSGVSGRAGAALRRQRIFLLPFLAAQKLLRSAMGTGTKPYEGSSTLVRRLLDGRTIFLGAEGEQSLVHFILFHLAHAPTPVPALDFV
jgi:hypothetical protein